MTQTRRYFLNVVTARGLQIDNDGTLLPSLETARLEAIADARALMSEAIKDGQDISSRSIQITNEDGELLLVVPFSDAVIFTE